MSGPQALLQSWSKAIETLDPNQVLPLYHETDSSLWGTLAMKPLFGREQIRSYFDLFLACESMEAEWLEIQERSLAPGVVILNGSYSFLIARSSAEEATKVPARFSFVVREEPNGEWTIVHHHSSKFPEALMALPL